MQRYYYFLVYIIAKKENQNNLLNFKIILLYNFRFKWKSLRRKISLKK